MGYASFSKRTAAFLVDSLIYGTISWVINSAVGIVLDLVVGDNPDLATALGAMLLAILASLTVWALYFALPESSSWQATIGKKIFNLRVTDENGNRISFWRSVWRNFATLFSTLIFYVGFLMCIWTEKKQCLHDIMAGCLVLDDTPQEKKGCAIAAVVCSCLFFVGVLILGIVAAIAMPQYFRATERARVAEATTMLSAVSQSQQRYYLQTGHYARTWSQLDIAPENCSSENTSSCDTGTFTLELKSKGVSASRTGNEQFQYTLYKEYNATGNQIQCEPLTPSAKSVCAFLE